MPRTPLADFEPALKKRLEDLWGTPPNLYHCLANHPALVAAWSEFSRRCATARARRARCASSSSCAARS